LVTIIVFFHVLVCFLLLVVILLQSSKGGGLAGAFGGTGGMGAIFGGRGAATFLSKLTVVLAIIFMLSNVVQVFVIKKAVSSKSLIQKEMQKEKGTSAADMLPKIGGESSQSLPQPVPGQQSGNVDSSK